MRSGVAMMAAILFARGFGRSKHVKISHSIGLGNIASLKLSSNKPWASRNLRSALSSLARGGGGEEISSGRNQNTAHEETMPSSSRVSGWAAAAVAAVTVVSTTSADNVPPSSKSSQNSTEKDTGTDSTCHFPAESLRYDTYSGITIDTTKIPSDLTSDADVFGKALSDAMNFWKGEGKRGLWLLIPTSMSHLIPPCTKLGFEFYFAQPGMSILTKWLPTDIESRLPNGPTHQVGIGAFVLHPTTGKMLVVQEKTGPAAANKLWKLPTGMADPGEDIALAAVREVAEETGLQCTFDRILCFKQSHGGLYGKSDLFFVCLLNVDTEKYRNDIDAKRDIVLTPQEEEIAAATWIELEQFTGQDIWMTSPLYKEMNDAMIRATKELIGGSNDHANGEFLHAPPGFVAQTLPIGFRPGTNTIYVSKL